MLEKKQDNQVPSINGSDSGPFDRVVKYVNSS